MGRRFLSARVRREGCRLLHAQCWAWGQDIRHADGNLLLRYGFERLRPPVATAGCSQYTLRLGEGRTIRLWGFGVFVGERHGLYLNRFDFVPRWCVQDDVWTPGALVRGRRAHHPEYLGLFLAWAAAYESWIEDKMGPRYRADVLKSAPGGPDFAGSLSEMWQDMLERLADGSVACAKPRLPDRL